MLLRRGHHVLACCHGVAGSATRIYGLTSSLDSVVAPPAAAMTVSSAWCRVVPALICSASSPAAPAAAVSPSHLTACSNSAFAGSCRISHPGIAMQAACDFPPQQRLSVLHCSFTTNMHSTAAAAARCRDLQPSVATGMLHTCHGLSAHAFQGAGLRFFSGKATDDSSPHSDGAAKTPNRNSGSLAVGGSSTGSSNSIGGGSSRDSSSSTDDSLPSLGQDNSRASSINGSSDNSVSDSSRSTSNVEEAPRLQQLGKFMGSVFMQERERKAAELAAGKEIHPGSRGDTRLSTHLPSSRITTPRALRIVVVGWMGSRKAYLNQYRDLWLRSGKHAVLMIRPSVFQTMCRWRGVVKAGPDIDKVARQLVDNPNMPTFYHVFSTGGFIHLGTMWRWMDEIEDVMQRRDMIDEVAGIILDSTPAKVDPEIASRAIIASVIGMHPGLVDTHRPGLYKFVKDFMAWYLTWNGPQKRTKEVYDAWYNMAPACPQLYLYSDSDPLAPAEAVERYMGVQESRGVEVTGYKWSGSGHVEHFRHYPHEYAYQISQFIAKALIDWDDSERPPGESDYD